MIRTVKTGRRLLLAAMPFVAAALLTGCPFRQTQKPGHGGEEPTIKVFFHRASKVKEMKMEDYLAGVVAGEMEKDFPPEAMGAQAIIARTFTLKHIQEGGQKFHGADVSTDPKEFQAYNSDNITDKVLEAIKSTRGEVMTYQGGLVQAFFHSCSGGRTATAQEGLEFNKEATPYLKSIKDFPCERKQNWQATFTTAKIKAAAAEIGSQVKEVDQVRIGDKGPSGRATTLVIGGATVSAPSLRVALDPEKMRSTWIDELRVEGDQVFMKGRGFGHGVGMSQFGAKKLADDGKSAEEIVNFYYQGADIQKRWR